ncbi:nucleoside hydrolase [Microbacterium sp. 179-I 3D2 NHS]|uniref:uridine-preferring nucleoside hydrolase UriH n=1 Tax=Microbacterium sp. 179-I 3D2 NHS TaxID=3235178 RepID=UPI0039A357B5
MTTKIILDCDPGHDDAIAMLLAQGNPEIDLLAVTTVAGNQTLEKVTRNALAVADIAGMTDVPVAAGCDRPLVRAPRVAPDIHGESGMDGPQLPPSVREVDGRHAVDLIIETIMAEPAGSVTLVPTGALTNIALAVRREPRIADRVREVVLMGGALHRGNWSATSEFNIIVDPEAAHIVFNADWPVTMVGLDATHQALATPEVIERITAIGNGPSRFVVELLEFFAKAYRESQHFASPPVHDPVTVARVIDRSIVRTVGVPLDVELGNGLTVGMTVADLRAPADDASRTHAAVDLDQERFWGLIVDALERLDDRLLTPEE